MFDTTIPFGYSFAGPMDVICERCKAEYDFDESLLGDKGTTVKCSTCGHVFRVLPPRRDESRSMLRVRFARTGQIEVVASLRELQKRIHAGEIAVDDQLGREGFPWRRLGDVPELKNFFAPKPGAGATAPIGSIDVTPSQPLRVSRTSMPPASNDSPPRGGPPNANAKRTVLGIGPQTPHIPPPPRMPNVPGMTPPVQQPAVARSNGVSEPARPAGSAPSSAPAPAPISNAPTSPQAQRPAPVGLPPVSSRPPVAGAPVPRRSVPPTPSNPVRLKLGDEDAPPPRATEGHTKIYVFAALALVLAGGGWVAMNAMRAKSSDAAPAAPPAPRVEIPTPAPAVQPETPPTTTEPAAPANVAPNAPAPQPPAAAATPTPAPSPEPSAKATSSSTDKAGEGSRAPAAGASKEEPKDYGGWVARGDQAYSKGDLTGARKAYEAALALRGSGSEANTGLGLALIAEGRAREAIPYLDRAVGSGYADANVALGDAYRKLGQRADALEAYRDYLARLPSGSRASYVKAQIEALSKGGAAKSEPEPSAPVPGGDAYRPAGELTETPPAAPSAPAEPQPERAPEAAEDPGSTP